MSHRKADLERTLSDIIFLVGSHMSASIGIAVTDFGRRAAARLT
jgi:hypothetical protein